MAYPPLWRKNTDVEAAVALMQDRPFGQLITAQGPIRATRIPFMVDLVKTEPKRLRAHLNAHNPQTESLDGAEVLVTFSGPSTYVSPYWRVKPERGGTFDYEEVQVRGTIRVNDDIDFFRKLINDLSAMIEPQYAEVGEYPVWQVDHAPAGYVEDRFPMVTGFEIDIASIEMVSKLHQSFSEDDRRSIAEHLDRCDRDEARAIGGKIRKTMED